MDADRSHPPGHAPVLRLDPESEVIELVAHIVAGAAVRELAEPVEATPVDDDSGKGAA